MIGQITKKEGRLFLDTRALEPGEQLRVLVVDGMTGKPQWIDAEVVETESGMTISGVWGYSVEGLFGWAVRRP